MGLRSQKRRSSPWVTDAIVGLLVAITTTHHHNHVNGFVIRRSSKPPCLLTPPLHIGEHSEQEPIQSAKAAFDSIVLHRFACKRFRRFDDKDDDESKNQASLANPSIVRQALHCLELARRAPTAFNTQPFKVVLVHSKEQKEALAKFALGPNKRRVLDSDCTAVFLADREVMRSFPQYTSWLRKNANPQRKWKKWRMRETLLYISLFSSGYPIPRFWAAPISFVFRTLFSIVDVLVRWFYILPTLCSAETWAVKQVMLVAMTYLLGCTSRGLATAPMEGVNAAGMRKVLNIPRRFSVPLIVCTGLPHTQPEESTAKPEASIEALAPLRISGSPRYPIEEVIYGNQFGDDVELRPAPITS